MADFVTTSAWQNVTLTADETWQCKHGKVMLTTTDPGSASNAGIELDAGEGLRIVSGTTVYYSTCGAVHATMAREAL